MKFSGKQCSFDFSGPSDHAFLATFFYSYVILIFSKYSIQNKGKMKVILLSINAVIVILIIFSMGFLGETFLFEGIIGIIYGAVYCIACLSLDSEIHSTCEKIAFIVKTSRKYKFKLFFMALIMFILAVMYFNAALQSFIVDHTWVLNVINDCGKDVSNTN